MERGEPREAVGIYLKYLEYEPHDANAFNNLGVCYMEIGKKAEGNRAFEVAYALDDSNMSVLVNHARQQVDNHRIGGALPQLARARATIPNYPYTNAVYAAACLSMGDPKQARAFGLQAWLAQFDTLRLTNSFLFQTSYCDIPEEELATEHCFWAETCLQPNVHEALPEMPAATNEKRKMRIGYWSPDFRNHSVRYFFRPLQEGHDSSKVELFLYHDAAERDKQTDLIEAANGHFHYVNELSDVQLVDLIRSHHLDVLVELSGHTSDNRLTLMKLRLATLQVTGLGYPPTTGLSSIDYKLLDRHLIAENSGRFYAEKPMVLPNSFWCFDPLEEAPEPQEPPLLKNGYVTFAVIGNISKINPKMMAIWVEILRRVPKSRLLVRAVNFQDEEVIRRMESRVLEAGISAERIVFARPAGGADFYKSFNEIDIVLDTHPFNGGTTTCFAIYMGVPVISMSGQSLIGRMGVSVLSNIGAVDLIASTPALYVERAISLSQDIVYLKKFRRTSRARMKAGSLGDGRRFAQDIEKAFEEALVQREGGKLKNVLVPPLSSTEALRRAQIVLVHGQMEAAERIVAYALKYYPKSLEAHLMRADLISLKVGAANAVEYLRKLGILWDDVERQSLHLKMAQLLLLAREDEASKDVLCKVEKASLNSQLQLEQYQLLKARLQQVVTQNVVVNAGSPVSILVVIPCDEKDLFDFLEANLRQFCVLPKKCSLIIQRANEGNKLAKYRHTLSAPFDVVLFLQKNISIENPRFFYEVLDGLQKFDMLSFAGARRWVRLDWADDDYEQKASGLIFSLSGQSSNAEVRLVGGGKHKLMAGMVVLHGGLLVFKRAKLEAILFDEDYDGAGTLLEEGWTHAAALAGNKLAVHRGLGVRIRSEIPLDARYMPSAKEHLVQSMGFDPFALLPENDQSISVAGSTKILLDTLENFFLKDSAHVSSEMLAN